jgi:hypothetical protein
MAQGMSKSDYKTDKVKISANYTTAKAACASFAGNAKDICIAEARGKEKVEKAELEASYKPTVKTHFEVRIAKADADYDVAKERCDDMAGNAKDVCVKEAKAVQVTAKADAKVQMKTKDANAKANEKTTEVRHDAAADKREAQYKVEKEKCDALAGSAKDSCLTQATAKFGKL